MSVYDQLQALNIQLPAAAVPAAAYVPFVQTGNLVFLSGHIAKKRGKSGLANWAPTFPPKKASKPRAPWRLICLALCKWPAAAI